MFELQPIQVKTMVSRRQPAPSVFVEGELPDGFTIEDAGEVLHSLQGLSAFNAVEWAQYSEGGIALVWRGAHPVLFEMYDASFHRFTPGYRPLFTQAWLAHAQRAVMDAERRGLLLDAAVMSEVATPRWWHDIDPRLLPFLSLVRWVSGNVAGLSPRMHFEDIELHLGGIGTLAIDASGAPSLFRFGDLGAYTGRDPERYGRRVTLMGPMLDTINHDQVAQYVAAVLVALQAKAEGATEEESVGPSFLAGELDDRGAEELAGWCKRARDVFKTPLPDVEIAPAAYCRQLPSSEYRREQRRKAEEAQLETAEVSGDE